MRLPIPYRPEADIVAHRLPSLNGALDWAPPPRSRDALGAGGARQPPPFWAMESLLHEYPISSAEGLALMRLAEALLRVPDAETAIALTADQLGRADFDGAADSTRWRACRPRRSRCRRSSCPTGPTIGARPAGPPGRPHRGGRDLARGPAARAPVRAGPDHRRGDGRGRARRTAKHGALRFSYDMLGEGARTEADARRYLDSYVDAIESIAAGAAATARPSTTTASRSSSARCIRATRTPSASA